MHHYFENRYSIIFQFDSFFIPYLYLKDESARVGDHFHVRNEDILTKGTKQFSAFSTPYRLLDEVCCLSARTVVWVHVT